MDGQALRFLPTALKFVYPWAGPNRFTGRMYDVVTTLYLNSEGNIAREIAQEKNFVKISQIVNVGLI